MEWTCLCTLFSAAYCNLWVLLHWDAAGSHCAACLLPSKGPCLQKNNPKKSLMCDRAENVEQSQRQSGLVACEHACHWFIMGYNANVTQGEERSFAFIWELSIPYSKFTLANCSMEMVLSQEPLDSGHLKTTRENKLVSHPPRPLPSPSL